MNRQEEQLLRNMSETQKELTGIVAKLVDGLKYTQGTVKDLRKELKETKQDLKYLTDGVKHNIFRR